MLGVDIEFGNNSVSAETSGHKLPKEKPQARAQGVFQLQIVAPVFLKSRTLIVRIKKLFIISGIE